MTTFDDIPTDAEITGDVYRDCLNRVWVRTWQGWESASEPVIRKSIASIPGLVELVPVTEFVRVVDYEDDEIWWSPSEGDYHYVNPGSEMEPDSDWHPLYRRVEPIETPEESAAIVEANLRRMGLSVKGDICHDGSHAHLTRHAAATCPSVKA